MGKYLIEFSSDAIKDLQKIKKSGRQADMRKIDTFLQELQHNPRERTEQPEQLKYQKGEVWSRKINKKDRFIYRIYENNLIVVIVSSFGHYEDK